MLEVLSEGFDLICAAECANAYALPCESDDQHGSIEKTKINVRHSLQVTQNSAYQKVDARDDFGEGTEH